MQFQGGFQFGTFGDEFPHELPSSSSVAGFCASSSCANGFLLAANLRGLTPPARQIFYKACRLHIFLLCNLFNGGIGAYQLSIRQVRFFIGRRLTMRRGFVGAFLLALPACLWLTWPA